MGIQMFLHKLLVGLQISRNASLGPLHKVKDYHKGLSVVVFKSFCAYQNGDILVKNYCI